jgi:hypothetical protein
MIGFSLITGVAFGLEYFQDEEIGFGINLDLGIFRFTWFRDIEEE